MAAKVIPFIAPKTLFIDEFGRIFCFVEVFQDKISKLIGVSLLDEQGDVVAYKIEDFFRRFKRLPKERYLK